MKTNRILVGLAIIMSIVIPALGVVYLLYSYQGA